MTYSNMYSCNMYVCLWLFLIPNYILFFHSIIHKLHKHLQKSRLEIVTTSFTAKLELSLPWATTHSLKFWGPKLLESPCRDQLHGMLTYYYTCVCNMFDWIKLQARSNMLQRTQFAANRCNVRPSFIILRLMLPLPLPFAVGNFMLLFAADCCCCCFVSISNVLCLVIFNGSSLSLFFFCQTNWYAVLFGCLIVSALDIWPHIKFWFFATV